MEMEKVDARGTKSSTFAIIANLSCRVWGLGARVWDFESRTGLQGLGFRV